MFTQKVTAHIQPITLAEAKSLVTSQTRLMATRVAHDQLGRGIFPNIVETIRFASLSPGTNAIQLHYRGQPIAPDGKIPEGAVVTPYLIEVEEFQTE